jgi:hypothetical protein
MGAASSVKVFGVAITSEVAPHGCDAHGCAGGPQPPASGVAWAADIKTTQVYTHYAPDEHEIAMVNAGFGGESLGSNWGPMFVAKTRTPCAVMRQIAGSRG